MDSLRQKHRGLSQIEIVASSLIVGVMLVAALNTLGAVFRSQRLNAARMTGPGLAHELMGEILSLPYEDPEDPGGSIGNDSSESGGDRADFDDVDDYLGWSASPPPTRAPWVSPRAGPGASAAPPCCPRSTPSGRSDASSESRARSAAITFARATAACRSCAAGRFAGATTRCTPSASACSGPSR